MAWVAAARPVRADLGCGARGYPGQDCPCEWDGWQSQGEGREEVADVSRRDWGDARGCHIVTASPSFLTPVPWGRSRAA